MSAADALPRYQPSRASFCARRASAELALKAAREVTLAELPVARLLFRIRGLGARWRFAADWLVVRLFSGLTRRSWLRAAKRRAESG